MEVVARREEDRDATSRMTWKSLLGARKIETDRPAARPMEVVARHAENRDVMRTKIAPDPKSLLGTIKTETMGTRGACWCSSSRKSMEVVARRETDRDATTELV